jgi:ElaB/YqjD/DUF883 family membrane-anchored ribosome-binding protein
MVKRKTLRHEIDQLRSEIAALQAERASQKASATSTEPEPSPGPETVSAESADKVEAGDLEQAIAEFAETAEKEIAGHPAMAVGAAFVLGLLIGRLTKG